MNAKSLSANNRPQCSRGTVRAGAFPLLAKPRGFGRCCICSGVARQSDLAAHQFRFLRCLARPSLRADICWVSLASLAQRGKTHRVHDQLGLANSSWLRFNIALSEARSACGVEGREWLTRAWRLTVPSAQQFMPDVLDVKRQHEEVCSEAQDKTAFAAYGNLWLENPG